MKSLCVALVAAVALSCASSEQSSSSVPPTVDGWANGAIYEGYLFDIDHARKREVKQAWTARGGSANPFSDDLFGYLSIKLSDDNTVYARFDLFDEFDTSAGKAVSQPSLPPPEGDYYPLNGVINLNGLWLQTGDTQIRLQGVSHVASPVDDAPPAAVLIAVTCDMAYDQLEGDFKIACGVDNIAGGTVEDPWAFKPGDQLKREARKRGDSAGSLLTGSLLRRNKMVNFRGDHQPFPGEDYIAAAFPRLATSSFSVSSTSFGEFSFSSYSNSDDDDDDSSSSSSTSN